ncbi:hypothetical protein HBN50_14175 [Halobacteriovorax sp. GB3]|uniref:hypothetical protein n=1 Tax=Halobacteriovorax sp. GB3 TaxID=2719615 RepID=UPI002362A12D|nr:hypothetical protein [Halobacteriovorax sp. GB3]MDD0854256.1 hypothetical protein [Halobacteriovorax sp. GB3]
MDNKTKKFTLCRKFRQYVCLGSFIVSIAPSACFAGDKNIELLKSFNPNYKVQDRSPDNYVPNVEVQTIPERKKSVLEYVFVEDRAGVLVDMRNTLQRWDETNEYAKNWNLDTTGLYDIKDREDRVKYVNQKILKYLDKRVSGEVKQAKEGSTLHRVGQIQKSLKPQTNVAIASNVKLKVKARVLQGKTFIFVDNPYFDNKTTVSLTGKVKLEMGKRFDKAKLEAKTYYNVNEGEWVAYVDKELWSNTIGRVSSTQSDKDLLFSGPADKKVELLFNKPF